MVLSKYYIIGEWELSNKKIATQSDVDPKGIRPVPQTTVWKKSFSGSFINNE